MSQSRNATDSQALLQSMLQKLKLQSGREGQPYLHSPAPNVAAPTWGQDGGRGAPSNNTPVNGFGPHGVVSAAESDSGLKGRELQQPGHASDVDTGLVSHPTQRDISDRGGNKVVGQATQPGITPSGTGQLFPAKSLKDADITSSERTDDGRVSFESSSHKDAVTSMGRNQDQNQNQVFTPKVYVWATKPTDASLNTGRQESHAENGGFGALAQSKNLQIVPTDQITNSSFRRKQRSTENKTRRWTQKIKERWRDRPGSFGKKGKEEERKEDQKSEQGAQISPQNQLSTAQALVNTSSTEEERTLRPADNSDPSKTPLMHTEDGTSEGLTRSSGDFEFGLGSFSLLEEITTGQEWAKFLNPNYLAASADQSPAEQPRPQPNPYDSSQSSGVFNHQRGGGNQWSFAGTEASAVTDFSMAQISPDAFQAVNMDVSEGKQRQDALREADQSEPMEHGLAQSHVQPGDNGLRQQRRPPFFTQPADILNSSLRGRGHLNRKRQHQSAERTVGTPHTDKISDAKEAEKEGSSSPLNVTGSPAMETTGESQDNSVMSLYTVKSPPPPFSPGSFSPFAPKGVLKHSISQDSEPPMEVVSKRRRVEENRRVHFSEQVVTIDPPEVDQDDSDSEEDSVAEEDSFNSATEQEWESERAAMEESAPARRPVLPAWIRALKRKNMGRKHR